MSRAVLHILWVWTKLWPHIPIIVMWLRVLSLLMKTSVLCTFLSANSWQPLIFLLSPQFCLLQNIIQLESLSFSLKWEIQTTYEATPGPPRCGPDRLRWQAPPPCAVAFLPVLALPSSHVEVQGYTCRVSAQRKTTPFVPLVTVNPDSCRVCYKQTSHFFRSPALSTLLILFLKCVIPLFAFFKNWDIVDVQ